MCSARSLATSCSCASASAPPAISNAGAPRCAGSSRSTADDLPADAGGQPDELSLDHGRRRDRRVFRRLHRPAHASYQEILAGRGFGLDAVRPSIEIVSAFAHASHAASRSAASRIRFVAEIRHSNERRQLSRGYARFPGVSIHESSYVDDPVAIGEGTVIWHFCHVLAGSTIGRNCSIGQNVMIGPKVTIGSGCKIQNNVSLYQGVALEDDVFCGPSCVFTNVLNPRAFISRKAEFKPTLVRRGATIGANATIVCGHTIGAYAFIAAGAVVTRDVADFALVAGVPARRIGWISHAGERLGRRSRVSARGPPLPGDRRRRTAGAFGVLNPSWRRSWSPAPTASSARIWSRSWSAPGRDVRAFVLYNSFDKWGWLDTVPEDVRAAIDVVMGDVRDANGVRTAMKGCDSALHLAALIGIPYSYHAADSYVDVNVRGTLNVVQAARELGLSKVVVTSTSEVYGTAQFVPITEEHPLVGQSPYAATKIGADQVALSFYRSFGTPVAVARPFNTYGPRQSSRAVIPTVITQLAERQRHRAGSAPPSRPAISTIVADTVRGIIAVHDSPASVGEVINIGSGFEVSVGDTVALIAEVMGRPVSIECENERLRPAKSEVERLWADNAKARRLLGWQPEFGGRRRASSAGLKITVDWFSDPANLAQYRAGRYTI